MNRAKYPILEFDEDPRAAIEPSRAHPAHDLMPQHCVLCFFRDVFDRYLANHPHQVIKRIRTEGGPHTIFRVEHNNRPIALAPPGVGAPLATVVMEVAASLGARYFVSCGSSGVLEENHQIGRLMVPKTAIRDEGTSYHYLPPEREVRCGLEALAAVKRTLDDRKIPYEVIKTWTTDAFYRETRDKVRRRRDEGCVAVEMECAALFAVAQHRGLQIASILYAADDLSGDVYDRRDYTNQPTVRENLLTLAMEACLDMDRAPGTT